MSKREGGKHNLPIAQISEVRKHVCVCLGALVMSGQQDVVLRMLRGQATDAVLPVAAAEEIYRSIT